MTVVRIPGWIAAVALLLGVANPWPAQAVPCGPGANWVDNCPSGTDLLNSMAQHGIVIVDPEDSPGGVTSLVIVLPLMTGPTNIFRGPGTPGSTAGGSHHISTEMVSLSLTGGGFTLTAGDGTGNLASDGPLHSPGRIDETSNPFIAHSFFDVFFELSPTPFGPLHNIDPCRMAADIDRVPPAIGTTYLGCGDPVPGQPIDLFDANDVHRAILTNIVTHTIVPQPSALILLGSGLVILGTVSRRFGTARRVRSQKM